MEKECITVELPANLAQKLHILAAEEQTEPAEIITRLIDIEYQRRNWQRDLNALRAQIVADGGLPIGTSKEEIVKQLRQNRKEIFDAEYAHLYR
jgi:predicted transcriptional regulator